MADDSRETEPAAAHAAAPAAGATPKFHKGVILGKDGKPCRACNTFAAFSQQGGSLLKKAPNAAAAAAATTATTTTSSSSPGSRHLPPSDCPADVEALGRSSWTLLHSIAATYPERPSRAEQDDVVSFVRLFSRLYPCWVCAEDFQAYIGREPVRARSRDEFGTWLCGAHNDVNRKLGKPVFDCSLWQERWRTGWKDGRCD